MESVEVLGSTLWGGKPARVILRRRVGEACLVSEGARCPVGALRVVGSARSTTVAGSGLEVGMVEHLFAALAALGLRDGLEIEIVGHALPLLDGGAKKWMDALASLNLQGAPAQTRVARAGTIRLGNATLELAPGDSPQVEVEVVFDGVYRGAASWDGRAESFRERIAAARTFAIESDVARMSGELDGVSVPPESVLIVGPDGIRHAGSPAAHDEPARHKLLDLVGDAYLHGGPPRGRLRAIRPSHAFNHAALEAAFRRGFLARD